MKENLSLTYIYVQKLEKIPNKNINATVVEWNFNRFYSECANANMNLA